MEYEIGDGFIDIINQNKKRLIGTFIFQIVVAIFYNFKVCHEAAPSILALTFFNIFIVGFFAYYQYEEVIMPGQMVNKIALKVFIKDEEIIISTRPFKLLFYINKPSQTLKFNINNLKIKKVTILTAIVVSTTKVFC